MGVVVSYDSTMLSILLELVIKKRNPLPGGTRVQAARNEALLKGWQDGVGDALAAYGTQLRLNEYERYKSVVPEEKWIPSVDTHHARGWVKRIIDRWESGEWTGWSDIEWLADVTQSWLDDVVFPPEIADELERRRRKLVLAGGMDPKPEDVEWIAEERAQFLSLAAPYDKALQKLGVDAGFKPRRAVKDTPQA